MNATIVLFWTAGLIQIGDAGVNLLLPRPLRSRENLARVSPMIRQVFLVHWFYVLLTLVIFGAACLLFAPELTSGSPLARFLCGAMAVFWGLRIPIQLLVFDRDFRRRYRAADIAFTAGAAFLAIVFASAALRSA
jgi:hypothetical protein